MALDPNREIYPNAPLKLVAFELRYPPVPLFEAEDGKQALYAGLREEFPILGPPPSISLEVVPTGTHQRILGTRVLDRKRRQTVTVTEQALTVETSAYVRYEDFAELIERALTVADGVGRLPAIQRIGLRYIDEIVVPGVDDTSGWREYIADDLVAAARFEGYPTVEYRGALGLQVADQHVVAVRFGIVDTPVVDPGGPLQIPESPPGKYFLLDIDSAWTAPAGEFPEFETAGVLARTEELHGPIRSIFERAIKPKLRDEVLRRKEPNG